MKKNPRTFVMYLEDILLSINRIEEYIENYSFLEFKRDNKTVDAVIRNFEIIGEASGKLPDHLKKKHANVPWIEMYNPEKQDFTRVFWD
jgi:uncharacterized protein with HEPN domain